MYWYVCVGVDWDQCNMLSCASEVRACELPCTYIMPILCLWLPSTKLNNAPVDVCNIH